MQESSTILRVQSAINMQPEEVISTGSALGVPLNAQQAEQFCVYSKLLLEWNERFNLTAIKVESEVLLLHFADSLTMLHTLPQTPSPKLIDVGAGAGFPGLALAIARPDLLVTLIDGTGKKAMFCNEVIKTLGLKGARSLHGRAEELAQQPAHRERYDVVTARAVAQLRTLAEYLLPFARVGGLCVAMKASSAAQEVREAAGAIQKLGGRLRETESVTLPGLPDKRALVLIDKIAATAPRYPRPAGAPRNAPL